MSRPNVGSWVQMIGTTGEPSWASRVRCFVGRGGTQQSAQAGAQLGDTPPGVHSRASHRTLIDVAQSVSPLLYKIFQPALNSATYLVVDSLPTEIRGSVPELLKLHGKFPAVEPGLPGRGEIA